MNRIFHSYLLKKGAAGWCSGLWLFGLLLLQPWVPPSAFAQPGKAVEVSDKETKLSKEQASRQSYLTSIGKEAANYLLNNLSAWMEITKELKQKQPDALVITMGRSPTKLQALLELADPKGAGVKNMPLSINKMEENAEEILKNPIKKQKLYEHLDRFLPKQLVEGLKGRSIVLVDYVDDGHSLMAGGKLLEAYLKARHGDRAPEVNIFGFGHKLSEEGFAYVAKEAGLARFHFVSTRKFESMFGTELINESYDDYAQYDSFQLGDPTSKSSRLRPRFQYEAFKKELAKLITPRELDQLRKPTRELLPDEIAALSPSREPAAVGVGETRKSIEPPARERGMTVEALTRGERGSMLIPWKEELEQLIGRIKTFFSKKPTSDNAQPAERGMLVEGPAKKPQTLSERNADYLENNLKSIDAENLVIDRESGELFLESEIPAKAQVIRLNAIKGVDHVYDVTFEEALNLIPRDVIPEALKDTLNRSLTAYNQRVTERWRPFTKAHKLLYHKGPVLVPRLNVDGSYAKGKVRRLVRRKNGDFLLEVTFTDEKGRDRVRRFRNPDKLVPVDDQFEFTDAETKETSQLVEKDGKFYIQPKKSESRKNRPTDRKSGQRGQTLIPSVSDLFHRAVEGLNRMASPQTSCGAVAAETEAKQVCLAEPNPDALEKDVLTKLVASDVLTSEEAQKLKAKVQKQKESFKELALKAGSAFALESFKFHLALAIRDALFAEKGLGEGVETLINPMDHARFATFGTAAAGTNTLARALTTKGTASRWLASHAVGMPLAMGINALVWDLIEHPDQADEVFDRHLSMANAKRLGVTSAGFMAGRPIAKGVMRFSSKAKNLLKSIKNANRVRKGVQAAKVGAAGWCWPVLVEALLEEVVVLSVVKIAEDIAVPLFEKGEFEAFLLKAHEELVSQTQALDDIKAMHGKNAQEYREKMRDILEQAHALFELQRDFISQSIIEEEQTYDKKRLEDQEKLIGVFLAHRRALSKFYNTDSRTPQTMEKAALDLEKELDNAVEKLARQITEKSETQERVVKNPYLLEKEAENFNGWQAIKGLLALDVKDADELLKNLKLTTHTPFSMRKAIKDRVAWRWIEKMDLKQQYQSTITPAMHNDFPSMKPRPMAWIRELAFAHDQFENFTKPKDEAFVKKMSALKREKLGKKNTHYDWVRPVLAFIDRKPSTFTYTEKEINEAMQGLIKTPSSIEESFQREKAYLQLLPQIQPFTKHRWGNPESRKPAVYDTDPDFRQGTHDYMGERVLPAQRQARE